MDITNKGPLPPINEPGALGYVFTFKEPTGGGLDNALSVGKANPRMVAVSALHAFQALSQFSSRDFILDQSRRLSQQGDFPVTLAQIFGEGIGDGARHPAQ